jgi:hypothetical protein
LNEGVVGLALFPVVVVERLVAAAEEGSTAVTVAVRGLSVVPSL